MKGGPRGPKRSVALMLIAVVCMVCLGGALGGYFFLLSSDKGLDLDLLRRLPFVGSLIPSSKPQGSEVEKPVVPEVDAKEMEREQLDRLSRELESRRAELDRLEATLSEREARLSSEREALRGYEDYGKIAKLYSLMRPEEAAKVMKELPDDLVISLLVGMDEERAAKILANLEPEHAARLTRAMGERRVAP